MQTYTDVGIDQNERELNSFYEKVRHHLDDLESAPSDDCATSRLDPWKDLKEEDLYGNVTKKELSLLLQSYDSQQENKELEDEPVKCKEVFGHNFARLLHSKPGFHHFGSTSYLVQDLKINDTHRNSFLNGHTSYRLNEDEKLDYIYKQHHQIAIINHLSLANKYLDKNAIKEAKEEIEKALQIDPKYGDSIGTLARLQTMEKKYDEAFSNFELALKCDLRNPTEIKNHYSEALSQVGMIEYFKKNYVRAMEFYEKSLQLDGNHHNSKLHLGLCRNQIEIKNKFGNRDHSYRR